MKFLVVVTPPYIYHDAYICLWVHMEYIPSLVLLIPKKHPSDTQLIRFHLALPTGYIYSDAFFCATTEMSIDTANDNIMGQQAVLPHLLKIAAAT